MVAQAAGVHGAHTHGRVLGASASEAAAAAAARAAAAADPEFATDLALAATGSGSTMLPLQAAAVGGGSGVPAVIVLNQLEVGPQSARPWGRTCLAWQSRVQHPHGHWPAVLVSWPARPVCSPDFLMECERRCACNV